MLLMLYFKLFFSIINTLMNKMQENTGHVLLMLEIVTIYQHNMP